jgi:hypothetical protein
MMSDRSMLDRSPNRTKAPWNIRAPDCHFEVRMNPGAQAIAREYAQGGFTESARQRHRRLIVL